MNNLDQKETEAVLDDTSLIKALAIAFPQAKIASFENEESLKFTADKIDATGFKNLSSISVMYKREVEIRRSGAKLTVELKKALED